MDTLNSKLAVNQACRHEYLQAEVNRILEECNLPGNPKIPEAKK
ncbi:Hypothetical protein P9303_25771 [Prochlorococcus marinus str. MIT 9303]|uniref:Uncharacterized protein n=1 Tax=Prochlorococcus marinus (strain MIT 9303) TaxID=59922 RepID=A2CCU8_PROM3|nr:Hypothetical protein P9303_25771 [Prochlorococcus marinus str. MIT 9303]